MRAVTWQGKRSVSVDDVPDPRIEEPTDAIIKVTTTNICGSDLHLYETLGMFMTPGDVIGHEPMGIVEEVGTEVTSIKQGDRVVIPFQIACGHCYMCQEQHLYTQCETTQVRDQGTGAALFGYSKLYGEVPGGQAEYLRVPQAQFTNIVVPEGPADDRFVYLSDVLPTAWQAVEYAAIPPGGTVAILGLGPIGDMATRIALHRGAARVIGVDLVPERLERARARGADVIDLKDGDIAGAVRELTAGRGPDAVIDAVGMEAHGSPATKLVQQMTSLLPDAIAAPLTQKFGVDRLHALYTAIDIVRRGGTISLIGVYGGMVDPIPMLTLFDKQVQVRMGQANVKRWVDDILPLLVDDDPLGVDDFATHRLPLEDAPHAYEIFQKKADGAIKIQLKP
ncbi:MAG: S-(hydroxymethyl)glutathione dehydrogenase [Actinomycetia bacterium]|nr:S-(hydroxymethyl)glutathione dehydrogenase [Actinomycetes bacterium]